jgi:asparagine synthase (glutamine-hydrolysing)
VAFGHLRLAIIDLSHNGLQPMADPSGRFHLIFNGELYNYLELRQQLAQRGEIFRTETDSEVLLRAYKVWGEQALARFRGMFAFVIWDDMEKRLFAARDRFGIKPLYLVANDAGVALASEIKQLLGLPGLTGRPMTCRARDFLAGGIADHTARKCHATPRWRVSLGTRRHIRPALRSSATLVFADRSTPETCPV